MLVRKFGVRLLDAPSANSFPNQPGRLDDTKSTIGLDRHMRRSGGYYELEPVVT